MHVWSDVIHVWIKEIVVIFDRWDIVNVDLNTGLDKNKLVQV